MGGISGIPISEFEAYCRMEEVEDPEDVEELFALISAMDSVYIATVHEKQEQNRQAARLGKK